MNDEPTTGSPPIPTIVELPRPSCVSSWPIWYVSVPERLTSPIAPSRKISAGMIPTFALAGESARAVRAQHRDPLRADVVVDAEHVVGGQALGDANHRLDSRVDGLVDRVGGEPRRDEDHRRVRPGLVDRLRDGVEDGDPLDVVAALPRSDPRHDLRTVVPVPHAVERALSPGEALDDEPCLAVDDDRH